MTQPADLVPFLDPLPVPPLLRAVDQLTVRLSSAQVRLHSQLPPTPMWTYDGRFPGPTIEVRRGQRLRVEWQNVIDTPFPVLVGDVPAASTPTPPPPPPENVPGIDPGLLRKDIADLPAWNVVHLHAAVTGGGNDGWTENAVPPGQSQLSGYPNDQPAAMLWYHDHAMDITRLNVMAGLVGGYLVRDDEEDALGLPGGEFEVPLILCDRNLATAEDGSLTGQLLYKTSGPLPFFGPYNLVNGAIWPHFDVRPRWYRFRVLNASHARTFRLHLVDETLQRVPGAVWQIGTDGGLLGAPLPLSDQGLALAPAERADLLVDFGALAGRTLRLVNSSTEPFAGVPLDPAAPLGLPDPAHRLPEPGVMEFRVADEPPDDTFTLPASLSPSYVRISHDSIPADHNHRVLMLSRSPSGTFQLWEMAEVPADRAPAQGAVLDGIVQVRAEDGTVTTYQRMAADFDDRVNWRVRQDGWEVWTILNLSIALHPVHIHLIRFQEIGRSSYDVSSFLQAGGGSTGGAPVTWLRDVDVDPTEQGWKDVIRVAPGQLVRVAGKFTGATGRFMYHCHILDHEDDGMMRPFVVMPGAVLDLAPGMGTGGGMPM